MSVIEVAFPSPEERAQATRWKKIQEITARYALAMADPERRREMDEWERQRKETERLHLGQSVKVARRGTSITLKIACDTEFAATELCRSIRDDIERGIVCIDGADISREPREDWWE